MSKAALKKALATMTPEQMAELLLDLYSARPEAKEYLEFFLNPDIDKLMRVTTEEIVKEVSRKGRYGYCKPRITRIKGLIKKVATLNPGPGYALRLRINTIHAAAQAAMNGSRYTDAYRACFKRILSECVSEADHEGVLDETVSELQHIISAIPSGIFRRTSSEMCSSLKEALEEALAKVAGHD